MTIDFTTTATCRPQILEKTYASFSKNLTGIDMKQCRLFINIDPIPWPEKADEVLSVAKKYFGEVIENRPVEASFPKALIWCWRQPTTEFFFHLEDDWIMTAKLDISCLVDAIQDRSFANIRAYLFRSEVDKICLSPCLGRTNDAKAIADKMRDDVNPEKQLRPMTPFNPYGGLHEGHRSVHIPREPILRDIGRVWLEEFKWAKTNPEAFTTWKRTW